MMMIIWWWFKSSRKNYLWLLWLWPWPDGTLDSDRPPEVVGKCWSCNQANRYWKLLSWIGWCIHGKPAWASHVRSQPGILQGNGKSLQVGQHGGPFGKHLYRLSPQPWLTVLWNHAHRPDARTPDYHTSYPKASDTVAIHWSSSLTLPLPARPGWRPQPPWPQCPISILLYNHWILFDKYI